MASSGAGPGRLDSARNRTRLETQVHLFRTPLATDGTNGGPNQRDSSGGLGLSAMVHLFKTPTSNLGSNGGAQPPSKRRAGGHGPTLDDEVSFLSGPWISEDGKDYGPAVRRWEDVTGRPAPEPVEPGQKVSRRLSRHFTEWLMGLPEGWVTDVPGLTRNEVFTVLGNGVVPQQAEAAFRHMLDDWPSPSE